MQTKKQKVIIWLIVILLVMNVSTFISIAYHLKQTKKMETAVQVGQKKSEIEAEKYSGRYFRDQLKLDANQMDIFRQFNRIFRQKARSITLELADKRKMMLEEMTTTDSDSSRLMVLSDSIGILHGQLKHLTFTYYLDIKKICNKDQQVLLQELFKQIFLNDAQMGYPGGPGNGNHKGVNQRGGGQGRGRPFN